MGCRPRARSVLRCHSVLVLRHSPVTAAVCRTKASCKRTQASGELAVQKGRQKSRFRASFYSRFRQQRLAVQAARCAGPARGRRQVGSWQCRKAGKSQGLELVSSRFRKWRLAGLSAAGPIRPSLPWCFDAATRSSRGCAGRKPAVRWPEQAGSWQCKRAGKVKVWS